MRSMRMVAVVALAAAGSAMAQENNTRTVQEPVKRGYLGAATTPINAGGELIVDLDPQGAAAAAGLKVGDVILKVDNQTLSLQRKLVEQMKDRNANQAVTLSVKDATGNVVEKSITLRDRVMFGEPRRIQSNYGRNDDDLKRERMRVDEMLQQAQFGQPPAGPRPMLGVTIRNVDPGFREQFKLGEVNGAVIGDVRPGSPAADAKLQVNDVVTQIDATAIASPADLQKVIGAVKPDSKVTLKVFRDGKTIDVPVTVKSMTMPAFPGMSSGFSGTAAPIDLFGEINALKQRVEALEARVRVLEGGRGSPPAPMKTPPAPKQP